MIAVAAALLSLLSFSKDSIMVPMRDSTKLNTNVYKPADTTDFPLPVILIRTPYGADRAMNAAMLWDFTDTRRYIVVTQDTRGRFESEGVDSVFLDDGWRHGKRDGYDCVDWIVGQPWCDGRVGTLGGSACAITQLLLAGAAHPGHLCANPIVGAFDMYRHGVLPGGEYRQFDIDGWLNGQGSGYMRDYYLDHYCKDSVWSYLDVWTRKDSVQTAMFHYGGWYDLFSQGTVEAFQALRHLGNQRLLMGPWSHQVNWPSVGEVTYPNGAFDNFTSYANRWCDFWLKDSGSVDDIPQVSYYLMGPVDTDGYWNAWYEADDWPPTADTFVLYLREDSSLTFEPPTLCEPPDTFAYDPRNPVPTNGGNNLSLPAGPYDQEEQWVREDVLRYVSPSLEYDAVVKGRILVRLSASSDRLDTDFTAKLIDIYPAPPHRKMLVIDGILMARHRLGLEREDPLSPGEVYEFEIDLQNTAYCFPAGHRIGLAISSSNSPRFRINLNNGGHPLRDTVDTLVATNVIHHSSEHPSRIVFQGVAAAGVSEGPIQRKEPAVSQRSDTGIFDVLGRRVFRAADERALARLGPGCYFIREGAGTRKVVLFR